MKIQNNLSWSFSRQQTLESCARRYYYRYYAFWEGWDRRAPEEARKAYLFSKMQTLPMLVGTAVHETLAEYLNRHAAGRPLADPEGYLRERLNRAWVRSRDRLWETEGPKKAPPLFEHYYEVAVAPEQLERARETAFGSLRSFLHSDLHHHILAAGRETWRAIEALTTIEVDGTPAYVAPDFAYDRDGETWLLDWKTGGAREDMKWQLAAYALHARDQWQVPVERLRAFDVFLADDALVEVPLDAALLEAVEARIRDSLQAMRQRLTDVAGNVARVEDFEGTEDARECGRCFFQELCDVRQVQERAQASGD